MADNETTGTGKDVATDKITYSGDAGMNLQLVHPVFVTGAEGSKTAVEWAYDTNRGIYVASHLHQVNIPQTPTCSTSPAYTAGDAIGGLLTFANAARWSGGSGLIQAVTIMCKTPALVPVIELVLFNQTFTAVADNAAFNPSDADMANCIGVIPISAWNDYSLNSIATRLGLGFAFTLTGTSLFGQMVTRSAITLVSTTDLVVGLQIIQD